MAGLPGFASASDLTKFKSGDPDAIVRQAQRAVRNYCHWHIAPIIEQTFKLDGDGGTDLFLPTLEVVEILEVTNAGVSVDLVDLDDSEAGWLTLRRGTWSCRSGQVRVTLKHGFEEPPEDVVGVVTAVAARAVDSPAGRTRERGGQVDIGFALTGSGVSGGLALLEHEKALLDAYRVYT